MQCPWPSDRKKWILDIFFFNLGLKEWFIIIPRDIFSIWMNVKSLQHCHKFIDIDGRVLGSILVSHVIKRAQILNYVGSCVWATAMVKQIFICGTALSLADPCLIVHGHCSWFHRAPVTMHRLCFCWVICTPDTGQQTEKQSLI